MQNIEKNDQLQTFFGAPESFRFRNEKLLLQIKIAKKAFQGDCLQNPREASAFVTISVNAKI